MVEKMVILIEIVLRKSKNSINNKYCFLIGPSCWHIVDDGVYSISLTGTRQSPINIETDKHVIETDEALEELQFEYVPANCTTVGNTGASWKVDVVPDGSSMFIIQHNIINKLN